MRQTAPSTLGFYLAKLHSHLFRTRLKYAEVLVSVRG